MPRLLADIMEELHLLDRMSRNPRVSQATKDALKPLYDAVRAEMNAHPAMLEDAS